jgi:hypothetical protein
MMHGALGTMPCLVAREMTPGIVDDARSRGREMTEDTGLGASDEVTTTAEPPVEAFITRLSAAGNDARPFVSLLVQFGQRRARVEIETDAALIQKAALPEAIREELAWLIDALEMVAQPETPIVVRLDPLGTA